MIRSLPSRKFLPENTLLYRGRSMNPTFLDLDLLTYAPPRDHTIVPGDVIAFRIDPGTEVVIHRVIGITEEGKLRTQGDNNALPDLTPLIQGQVIGIVRICQRNRRVVWIRGGRWGLLHFSCVQERKKVLRAGNRLLGPLYRLAARYRLISRFTMPVIKGHVRTTRGRSGTGYQCWCFGRLAGQYIPDNAGWVLGVPFALVIDAYQLPVHSRREGSADYEN